MTNTQNTTSLIEYSREVMPKFRTLAKKKEILKEWAADDEEIAQYKEQIKEMQENIKSYIEDKEAQLVREIKDLTTDIGLACKAAAKNSDYEAKDLKAYFKKRSEDKVEEVVQKGVLFSGLEQELA